MSRMTGGSATSVTASGGGSSSNITQIGGAAIALGQTTMSASLPVVISSNQTSFPVTIAAGSAVIGHVVTDSGSVVNATLQTQTDTVMVGGVNIKEINAVTPLMGNGTTGTGSLRVTIASDNTAFAVNSTLSAETTKVIGVVRASDGAGNLLTSNSTTYTAKFGLDSNLLGTLGTAFSTAGKVDVKGADGDVFVRQATASNLNATVVGTGTFAVQAAQSGNWTARVVGNAGATIDAVVGAGTAPTNMLAVGGLYNSTEISPTTGQSAALQLDSKGRLRQVLMDAAGNTRGANVDANNNLGVVLAAETTKVLGVTRTADGAGNLLTTNSTTYTAKFGIDGNLLGTLGTAFSTAGKVDVKGADGDLFVRQATGSNLHTVVDSGTVTTVSNISQIASVTPTFGDVNNSSTETGALNVAPVGRYNATQPTLTDTRYNQLQVSSRGELLVAAGVTGLTVTANAGTNLNTSALALDASVAKLTIAQGTALGSNTVALIAGSVTTNAPTFTTGQINQLSLTTAGGLRVDLKDSAANTNNFNVNLAASAATVTVSASNLSTNISQINGVTPLMGNGASGTGALRVTIASDSTGQIALAAGSATIGALTANQSVNNAQIAGNAVSTGVGATGTGVQRMVIANDAGRTLTSKGGTVSSSGNNTIISAGTNKLKVYAFSLSTTSTSEVTCIFQSGAGGTELWRVDLQASTGTSTGANLVVQPPAWLFATASATLLNLNISAAVTVHYAVSYFDEA